MREAPQITVSVELPQTVLQNSFKHPFTNKSVSQSLIVVLEVIIE